VNKIIRLRCANLTSFVFQGLRAGEFWSDSTYDTTFNDDYYDNYGGSGDGGSGDGEGSGDSESYGDSGTMQEPNLANMARSELPL